MTAATLILLAAVAGTLLGYALAQSSDYADRDLPGLVDVMAEQPEPLRPWWLPRPFPHARFTARGRPDVRRFEASLREWRRQT